MDKIHLFYLAPFYSKCAIDEATMTSHPPTQDLHFCPVHEAVLELEFTKVSNHAAIFSFQCYAVLFNYCKYCFLFFFKYWVSLALN